MKVILERRWRDVIATFNFPPTTTSASFVLRKYYLSLLHHYEQVYFFRTQGPLVAPSGNKKLIFSDFAFCYSSLKLVQIFLLNLVFAAILQTKTPLCKLEPGAEESGSDPTMRKKRAHPPRPRKG